MSSLRLFLVVMITVSGLLGAYACGISLSLGFIIGLLALIGLAIQQGVGAKKLIHAMKQGILHTKEVIWILVLIGILIPSWTASGTIPFLIDAGLDWLNPAYYVTFAFVFSSLISMILGTSSGTLSAVGIPLIGIAGYLDIPLALVAGALVSGAFVGDRTSPFSSAHRLVASSTGMSVKQQYKYLLPTTVLAYLISVIFYGASDVLGKWASVHELVVGKSVYEGLFHYSPWLWIPLILLLGTILLRIPIKYGFLMSTTVAVVLGTYWQGIGFFSWLQILWSGYSSSDILSLHTKGLSDMIDLVILIALAGAYNGILEETKMIEAYMGKLLGERGSMLHATWRISIFGFITAMLSCTQTLPIMMTGRNLLPLWEKRYPKGHLSRIVADGPLVFAPLVPWNLITILCATILGVPWEQYIVFTVFLWSLPLLTLLVSWYKGHSHTTTKQMNQSV
ncbi:sodium:proton antiporter [Paenibacillus albiflavus]|uniref:Sodium:proton antiporter n=1 Tax=Paenibacillus albiflavus TaxID=2545760 RepID=A0A4R4E042_9BACL|nr:Na+/H+ antiporter NhaC family protein [Paenibacillus albiflavus]TCZ72321.1 sodium:proton antiporter [Paenibacillus albiflavus]